MLKAVGRMLLEVRDHLNSDDLVWLKLRLLEVINGIKEKA